MVTISSVGSVIVVSPAANHSQESFPARAAKQ
jgi:hypothetical protein